MGYTLVIEVGVPGRPLVSPFSSFSDIRVLSTTSNVTGEVTFCLCVCICLCVGILHTLKLKHQYHWVNPFHM